MLVAAFQRTCEGRLPLLFRGHQMASSILYDLIREMYESINVGLVSTKNKKNRAPRIGLDSKNLC